MKVRRLHITDKGEEWDEVVEVPDAEYRRRQFAMAQLWDWLLAPDDDALSISRDITPAIGGPRPAVDRIDSA